MTKKTKTKTQGTASPEAPVVEAAGAGKGAPADAPLTPAQEIEQLRAALEKETAERRLFGRLIALLLDRVGGRFLVFPSSLEQAGEHLSFSLQKGRQHLTDGERRDLIRAPVDQVENITVLRLMVRVPPAPVLPITSR